MDQLQQVIQSYFGIEHKAIAEVAALFKPHQIKRGDFHTEVDRNARYMSVLSSGYMRFFAYHGGKEITQWIGSPGQFVMDVSGMLFDQPSRRNIQALTDCELLSISKTDYHRLNKVVKDWANVEKLFLAKCFITLEDRVFSFLSMTAEERYQMLFAYNSDLFNQVPLQYLASMLGMTPETLSRIRKKTS